MATRNSSCKHALDQIARCNRRALRQTGDVPPREQVAAILERAIDTAPDRHLLMLSLGEFVASALAGCVIDPERLSVGEEK